MRWHKLDYTNLNGLIEAKLDKAIFCLPNNTQISNMENIFRNLMVRSSMRVDTNATAFTNEADLYASDRKYLYENLPDPLPKAFIVKKPRMRGGIKKADQWLTKAIAYFERHPDHIFLLLDYAKERIRARADAIKFTQKELGAGQHKRKGAVISNPINQRYMRFLDALEVGYAPTGKNSLVLKCGGKAADDLPFAFRQMMILLGILLY